MDSKPEYDTKSGERDSSLDQGQTQVLVPKPEILQRLSDDELAALEKGLTRKIDLRLLPSMILIYIMNYLDR